MKSTSFSLNTILICALITIVITFVLPRSSAQAAWSPQAAASCDPGRTIQVSGTAVLNVVPDRALIQLGLKSDGSTPQLVEATNSATIAQMTKALRSLGIDDKDIVTDWYVLNPVYDEDQQMVIKGYHIDNVVAVTLRDITKVNQVIAAALGAGANQVVNVEFYLSDLRKHRDQAREMAMKAALEKAQALAGTAGTQIGCVVNINENIWSYYNGWWYGRSSLWSPNAVQNVAQNVAQSGGEQEGALTEAGPVNLGRISVRAEVSASFSLK